MVDKAVGKYERVTADKYEEFLTELGVNFLLRKAATASTPTMEVSLNKYKTRSQFLFLWY